MIIVNTLMLRAVCLFRRDLFFFCPEVFTLQRLKGYLIQALV